MKNLDLVQQKKLEIMQRINQAVKEGNEENFAQAFTEFTNMLQEAVLAEAKGLIQSNDNAILSGRGVRALTSEETEYYQKVLDAMKTNNPKQALTDVDNVLPKTVIDAIFEDLTAEHPLLNAINFQNTGALVEILVSTSSGVAGWGDLTATINKEIAGAFAVVDLTQKKLSAFIPISKAMLDLGPEWLDRYVRSILTEALATELEAAVVDGDGNGKPLGMTRALTGAVDGVYPRKNAIAVTSLDPETIGGLLNTISQGPNSKRRAVPKLLMVVSPTDYYTKVFPATTARTADGGFNANIFPYPVDVIPSPAVPNGHAVFGLASRYFFGLGTSKGGKLEYDDSYKFLEDQRVYLIKLYGNGRPLDANAFVYADISGLKPYVQHVYVTNADEFPNGTPAA
ncbi:MAG: phage major capsid protein [Clostridia bacterium]|nr:phage major capsid protein [Clostridia bacterium]